MTITLTDGPTLTLAELKAQAEANARLPFPREVGLQLIAEVERLEAYSDLLHEVLDELLERDALPPLMETDAHVEAQELVSRLTAKNLTSEQLDELVEPLRRDNANLEQPQQTFGAAA